MVGVKEVEQWEGAEITRPQVTKDPFLYCYTEKKRGEGAIKTFRHNSACHDGETGRGRGLP